MPKSVLITGAGSGFGKGASLALAERGHSVIATTETEAQAMALRAEAPTLRVEKLDITTNDVDKLRQWDIDVLVDNAGAGQTGPLIDVPIDVVRRVFEVNVFGTLAVTQAAAAGMLAKGAGRIIIVSSIAGVFAAPAFGPYSMSKHALEAMGKTLRAELAGQGIDVTLLNPGPYQTGFNDAMADSMWQWFDDDALNAPSKKLFESVGARVKTGQMDPKELVQRIVELVEADKTSVNNFMPPDILERMAARRAVG